jgi:hypothetical protein
MFVFVIYSKIAYQLMNHQNVEVRVAHGVGNPFQVSRIWIYILLIDPRKDFILIDP